MTYIKPPRENIRSGTTDEEIEKHVADSEYFFLITKLLEGDLDPNVEEAREEILMLLKLIYSEEMADRVVQHRLELINRRDIAQSDEKRTIIRRKKQEEMNQKQVQARVEAEIAEAEEDYHFKLEQNVRKKWFNTEK